MVHGVTGIENTSLGIIDDDFHTGNEGVLGVVGTHGNRIGVAVAHVDIYVPQGRIEGTRIGIENRTACFGFTANKPQKVGSLPLIPFHRGSQGFAVVHQAEHRALFTPSDHTDAGGDVDGAVEDVFSLFHKHDTFPQLIVYQVNGILQSFGIISPLHRRKIDGFGVANTGLEDRFTLVHICLLNIF